MNQQTAQLLRLIGEELDQMVFPTVHDGGLVWPARTAVVSSSPAKETQNDRHSLSQGKRASQAAGTSAAASGRTSNPQPARPAGNDGAPSTASSLARLARELDEPMRKLEAAYPGTESEEAAGAVWLRVPALLLPQLGCRTTFVVVLIPALKVARGWAFWDYGALGVLAIGPRHTNYGDASICAFDERDGTWVYGDSLVTLLDLYSVWAVRQLYLRQFGLWPGPQGAFSPFERLREYNDNERCGCDRPAGRYADCCKGEDLQLIAQGRGEYITHALLPRSVPPGVVAFARGMRPPVITYKGAFPHFDGLT